MKIPFMPVHVVTSKTLEARLDAAFNSGILEGKGYSRKQINKLLSANAAGPVGIRGLKRKAR